MPIAGTNAAAATRPERLGLPRPSSSSAPSISAGHSAVSAAIVALEW